MNLTFKHTVNQKSSYRDADACDFGPPFVLETTQAMEFPHPSDNRQDRNRASQETRVSRHTAHLNQTTLSLISPECSSVFTVHLA